MLTTYPKSVRPSSALVSGAVAWIDLLQPTDDETRWVEQHYHLRLPSRRDLSEVELSSRVAERGGVLFVNMPTIASRSAIDGTPSPVGFVLSRSVLVTTRYTELQSFDKVAKEFTEEGRLRTSLDVFVAIVDEMVDQSADLLEAIATDLDLVSRLIFSTLGVQARKQRASNDQLREVLRRVGDAGERLSAIRDSILGLQRIIPFVAESRLDWISHEIRTHLAIPRNDLASLNEYQTYLAEKVQFLLDAVLGFITIRQSDIFQVLTVFSVVGIFPTLVASIYGMNFKNMPELSWAWGYQWGLAMIVISAVVPLAWFKWRKWI